VDIIGLLAIVNILKVIWNLADQLFIYFKACCCAEKKPSKFKKTALIINKEEYVQELRMRYKDE